MTHRSSIPGPARIALAALVFLGWLAALLALAGWAGGDEHESGRPELTITTRADVPPSSSVGDPTLESALDRLVVAPEVDGGYDRSLFPHWIDASGNGCDTRDEVLIEESSTPPQVDPSGCHVLVGDWTSIYDGYVTDDPSELDVDHVVALAEAWRSGAHAWSEDRRTQFANDLDHPGALIAVTAATNRSKGDKDPANWQPPNRESWCEYTESWIEVKLKWDLTADVAEVEALRNMRVGCDG